MRRTPISRSKKEQRRARRSAARTRSGGEPDLSLAGGTFHIAYYDGTNKDLRYATSPDGSTWTLSTIATAGDSGNYPSLGITGTGGVRISYHHQSDSSLRAITGP